MLSREQEVAAHSETYPDRDFAGTVATSFARRPGDALGHGARRGAEPGTALRPGMLLSVRLYQAPRETIVVPEIAVIQVGTEASCTACRKTRRPSASRSCWDRAVAARSEITSGLAAGDTLVSEGAVKLRDGARVASAPASAAEAAAGSSVVLDIQILVTALRVGDEFVVRPGERIASGRGSSSPGTARLTPPG